MFSIRELTTRTPKALAQASGFLQSTLQAGSEHGLTLQNPTLFSVILWPQEEMLYRLLNCSLCRFCNSLVSLGGNLALNTGFLGCYENIGEHPAGRI